MAKIRVKHVSAKRKDGKAKGTATRKTVKVKK